MTATGQVGGVPRLDWPRRVDIDLFDAFVRLIKAESCRATYRAPYRPDYEVKNHYLEIDGWCYWFIHPNMLNREREQLGEIAPARPLSCRP